jgi:hypothetical protein
MPRGLPITDAVIAEYIKKAKRSANSALEQRIIEAAILISDQGPIEITAAAEDPSEKLFGKFQLPEAESWRNLILREVYRALCEKASTYRKAVAELKKTAVPLIGAVAGYLAAKLGVGTAVLAALVAALLKFVLQIGPGAFCGRMSASFKSPTPR